MIRSKIGVISTALFVCVLGVPSFAADTQKEQKDKAVGIECMPAKTFVKILGKLDSLKPERKDSVGMSPEMSFTVNDGGVLPERVFFRHEGTETPFILEQNGHVSDFTRIKNMNKKGKMCLQDPSRIEKSEEENGLELNIDMDLAYHNTSGTHSLVELKDGLKDGRSHIKKLVPAPMRMLIPKFSYLQVETVKNGVVNMTAYKAGVALSGLTITEMDGTKLIEYAQLESLGADSLKITGAPYTLGPTPSPKDIKDMESED